MWKQHETQAQPCVTPRRYKMALLTFVGLLAPVYLVPRALTSLIPGHPMVVLALAVACIVLLMTYLIMPALQRLFRPWLVPSPKRRASRRSMRA